MITMATCNSPSSNWLFRIFSSSCFVFESVVCACSFLTIAQINSEIFFSTKIFFCVYFRRRKCVWIFLCIWLVVHLLQMRFVRCSLWKLVCCDENTELLDCICKPLSERCGELNIIRKTGFEKICVSDSLCKSTNIFF